MWSINEAILLQKRHFGPSTPLHTFVQSTPAKGGRISDNAGEKSKLPIDFRSSFSSSTSILPLIHLPPAFRPPVREVVSSFIANKDGHRESGGWMVLYRLVYLISRPPCLLPPSLSSVYQQQHVMQFICILNGRIAPLNNSADKKFPHLLSISISWMEDRKRFIKTPSEEEGEED